MSKSLHQLQVYRGWLEPGQYVWSPFVTKLEARFRFASLSYTTDSGSVPSAPKGKIPYVAFRLQEGSAPVKMGDSSLIIKKMIDLGKIPDLNATLQPEQKAADLGIRALLEDKLYFCHGRERWVNNYYTMRDHVLWAIPFLVRFFVGILVYRKTLKTLYGQGMGRHTDDEIRAFRLEIWETINGILTSSRAAAVAVSNTRKPFWLLGGTQPTEADAVLFGFVVSVLVPTACPESQQLVKGFPVIVEYAERIHHEYFPDYKKWQ